MEVNCNKGANNGCRISELNQRLKIQDEEDVPVFQRVPIEIWEKIICDHLNSSRDLHNVYHSWSVWKAILEPTKSIWMFGQILRLIIERLYKQEILNCSLVCKSWCAGFDCFCENNSTRRPAFGDDKEDLSCKLDLRHTILHTTYGYYTFHSRWTSLRPNTRLLRKAISHPRNPIVGRCVMVEHCRDPVERQEYKCELGNRLLEGFGHHVYFLQICFYDTRPLEFLKRFVELFELADLSNLKSLEITKVTNMNSENEREVSSQITEYANNLTRRQKGRFPKNLENLICGLNYEAGGVKLKQFLMTIFAESLKTLEICKDTFTYPLHSQLKYLCDLRTKIETNGSLHSLLQVTSPIRRLELTVEINDRSGMELNNRKGVERLFRAINRFKDTLRYLKLTLRLKDCSFDTLAPFNDHNSLDLPNIKTFVVRVCPSSFNFIFGLRSLEFLHLERILMYEQNVFKQGRVEEKLDIGQKLKGSYNRKEADMRYPDLYYSNLWDTFKRLKGITVEVHEKLRRSPKSWEYRRNHYNESISES